MEVLRNQKQQEEIKLQLIKMLLYYHLHQVENNPNMSVCKLTEQTNIARSTCHRILNINSFFPYKVNLVHYLTSGDNKRRLDFLAVRKKSKSFRYNYVE